jgi:hypothetical protein
MYLVIMISTSTIFQCYHTLLRKVATTAAITNRQDSVLVGACFKTNRTDQGLSEASQPRDSARDH